MKLADLDDTDIEATLKITDLENLFDIFIDKKLNNVFNLNMTLYINVDKSQLPTFQVKHPMQWTLASYQIYGTTRLAWLLWKVNEVKADEIFKTKQPGDTIYYLPKQQVEDIISNINEFNG